uniref:Dolichol-phosphate mannosyltransferase subunit 1 n=1 Tax=Glossina morsitans morsitans TaxID=37546 RepID=A0A1B0G4A2_GLOMM
MTQFISGYEFEVVIIDGNSPHGTLEVAKELQNIYGENKIVLRPRSGKLGLSTAYIRGLKYATGNFVIYWMQTQPKFTPDLIQLQKKRDFDIVSDTRYKDGGDVCGWDFKRQLISRDVCIKNRYGKGALPVAFLRVMFFKWEC